MIFDVDPRSGGEESLIALEVELGQSPGGRSQQTGHGRRRLALTSGDPGARDTPVVECPDCSATWLGTRLAHDAGCPLNAAANAVSDADAAWFDAHPGKETYRRALTFAEILDLRLSGVIPDQPGRVTGRVTVTRIGPGLRMRETEIQFELKDES